MLVAIIDERRAADRAARSRVQLASADNLLKLLVDLETGQRGFVITRKERFLQPWKAALTALPTGARKLARNADDPSQARRAAAIARAVSSYVQEYSVPLVQAARRGDPSARSVVATEQGKRRVDALRLQFSRFTQAERDLIDSRQNRADADSNRAVVVAVGGLACSLLLILLFGAYLTRQVAAPVRRAAAMAGRLARGDLSARTPVGGPAEVGELEQALNMMAGSLEASRTELRASRARVVAAADRSRHQIERDLHDGAQQRLVTLALGVRTVEAMVPPELPDLKRRLAAMRAAINGVLEELQKISRGIHPAILSAGGIGPALKTLARRCPVPVELDVRFAGRLPEPVELTVYFVVSEALANAAKHSHASLVKVRFEAEGGGARLEVRDDGVGGANVRRGSGLVGLGDRLAAVGGSFEVLSPRDGGTVLRAEIPIGEVPAAPAVHGDRPGAAAD
jgi:signal transduction histidine kinase